MAANIWPCQPRWGSWAFKVQKLPGLDYEVRSPKFNVKHPDGKTDEEIVAKAERKVSDDRQLHSQRMGVCPNTFEAPGSS
jgi:hypothetical protein